MLDPNLRVILIGGTSHVGKSTLAPLIAVRVGGIARSTDKMARHPGRPWGQIPPQVIQHYLHLDVSELMQSVLTHYQRMAPAFESLVRRHAESEQEPKLVLEGSALLPETVSRLRFRAVAAIFLVADDAVITSRIRAESDYENREAREKTMIDKFIARALAFNRKVTDAASRLGLPLLAIDGKMNANAVEEASISQLKSLA